MHFIRAVDKRLTRQNDVSSCGLYWVIIKCMLNTINNKNTYNGMGTAQCNENLPGIRHGHEVID